MMKYMIQSLMQLVRLGKQGDRKRRKEDEFQMLEIERMTRQCKIQMYKQNNKRGN